MIACVFEFVGVVALGGGAVVWVTALAAVVHTRYRRLAVVR